jgi:hypothetical protein
VKEKDLVQLFESLQKGGFSFRTNSSDMERKDFNEPSGADVNSRDGVKEEE